MRDPHQPLARGHERLREPARHHALRQQLLRIGRPEARRRRPAAHAQIAQPARPVLEVGLEQEDRVAEAAVALLLLGAQARDEVLGRRLRDAGAERRQELVGQRPVAGQEAGVEQRRRRRQVVGRQRQRLIVGAHRVARRRPWRPTAGTGSPRPASARRCPASWRTAPVGPGPRMARAPRGRSRRWRRWRPASCTSRPRARRRR